MFDVMADWMNVPLIYQRYLGTATPRVGLTHPIIAPYGVYGAADGGEVLISIQSSPALMPLLKRGGAIVTDEGGIACHAAIISRELRKPTLIGTKSATSLTTQGIWLRSTPTPRSYESSNAH